MTSVVCSSAHPGNTSWRSRTAYYPSDCLPDVRGTPDQSNWVGTVAIPTMQCCTFTFPCSIGLWCNNEISQGESLSHILRSERSERRAAQTPTWSIRRNEFGPISDAGVQALYPLVIFFLSTRSWLLYVGDFVRI